MAERPTFLPPTELIPPHPSQEGEQRDEKTTQPATVSSTEATVFEPLPFVSSSSQLDRISRRRLLLRPLQRLLSATSKNPQKNRL